MNDMMHMKNNPAEYRYGQKECCVIKSNGEARWYTLIMLTNLNTMDSVVSEYSDYFFKNENMIKGAMTTKINNYGRHIVSFLNYIFYDRDEPLDSIEDISKDLGNEYLNKYSVGELKDLRSRGGYTISNAPDTVDKAKHVLTGLYYWLFRKYADKPVNHQWVKQYNLKYIFEPDFHWREVKTPAGTRVVLDNIFLYVETYLKDTVMKLENPSDLVVFELIEIARNHDPMIAFGLALQGCVGIRRGEVCQMHDKRIIFNVIKGAVRSLYINMETEKLLRNDGKRTGHIKRKRCQLAYPAFDSSFIRCIKNI